jgi:peptidoglycan/LPS O-acetylase OafA/YrhL
LAVQKTDSLPGLHVLRVFAVALVTSQHIFSLLQRDDLTYCSGVNLGQLGVAVFLFLAGYLASTSTRPAQTWLWARLSKIYPPFWLVMAFAFALTLLLKHKPISIGLFVSQMAGTGLFTHGTDLVNTPTWFLSLLLPCYLFSAATKACRQEAIFASLAVVVLAGWTAQESEHHLTHHALSYAWGAFLGRRIVNHSAGCLAGTVGFALAYGFDSVFIYPCLATLLFWGFGFIRQEPAWAVRFSELSYEYYLVHGIILFGAFRFLATQPALAISVGLAGSIAGAFVLRYAVEQCTQIFRLPARPAT